MLATDFEYDGILLSDVGFVVCSFDNNGGVKTVPGGSEITFTKVSHNNGKRYSLLSSKYEKCITAEFDICKNPETTPDSDFEIRDDELLLAMRWLNRTDFHKMRFIDNCASGNKPCYYNASFNIERIIVDDKLYGLHLTMETDSPFGYGDEYVKEHEFKTQNSSTTVDNTSSFVGFIYPNLEITCLENGDLVLTNETAKTYTTIKNCSYGEVITIKGAAQIVNSTLNAHDIANDFNYDFMMLTNNMFDTANTIKASKKCKVKFYYNPLYQYAP